MIEKGSPADKAGVKVADIIRKVNGTKVSDSNEAYRVIFGASVGDTITLTVERDGQFLTMKLAAGRSPGGLRAMIPRYSRPEMAALFEDEAALSHVARGGAGGGEGDGAYAAQVPAGVAARVRATARIDVKRMRRARGDAPPRRDRVPHRRWREIDRSTTPGTSIWA